MQLLGWRELDSEVGLPTVLERRGQIAAFTLINDWAPRDPEPRAPQTSRGPRKSTDFATATGPWLATPDELPDSNGHLDMGREPSGTGSVVTQGRCSPQRFTWPQMNAYDGLGKLINLVIEGETRCTGS